ncbi:WecB/TagA/CpsF family glycosyltransferase [bacterium]|nr:WecB/TagA/CpsF family glycosyltransferase [bacterium]
MRRASFHGIILSDTGIQGLIQWLVTPSAECRLACYLNAHTFNLATDKGSATAPLLPMFDVIYPDGMAVVWAARRKGFPVSERVSAADYFIPFCETAAGAGRRIALVGGAPGLAEGCAAELRGRVPDLAVAFTAPGFGGSVAEQADSVARQISETGAEIVLLGMGTPRQEQIAVALKERGVRATIWCVGALFEYYTPGVRSHAPAWMRRNGLEWLYRLILEPRRLARRYLIGNFVFIWRVLREVPIEA